MQKFIEQRDYNLIPLCNILYFVATKWTTGRIEKIGMRNRSENGRGVKNALHADPFNVIYSSLVI